MEISTPTALHDRFRALLGDTTLTAMTSAGPSALAGHVLVRWIGLNRAELEVRVNPYGQDLDAVLAEFAARCRDAAKQ